MKGERRDDHSPAWPRGPVSRWWWAVGAVGTLAAYGIVSLALYLEGLA